MLPFTVHPVGDSALLAVFTQRIAPEIGAAVAALNTRVLSANISGVDETVPAFASLMVTYDPLVTDYDAVAAAMQKLADVPDAGSTAENGKLVTIPVCYGGEFGPDLPFVARHAGLTEQEVIALHTGRDYRIYMLGFLPGFLHLGGWRTAVYPRLGTPRTAIPADQWERRRTDQYLSRIASPAAGSSSHARRSNCLTHRARCPMRRATGIQFTPSQKQNLMLWRKRRGRYEPESAGPRSADYRRTQAAPAMPLGYRIQARRTATPTKVWVTC